MESPELIRKKDSKDVNLYAFIFNFFIGINFRQVYQKANVVHGYVNVQDFYAKKSDWKKTLFYSRNRPIDDERVKIIQNKYHENCRKFGKYTFSGQITLGLIKGLDPKVLDGQHRLAALENTSTENEFMIVIINYDNEDERFEGFKEINTNLSVPDKYKFSTKETKDISDKLADKILELPIFKPYISTVLRNGVPAINKVKLTEKLCEVLPAIKVLDENHIIPDCISRIVKFNKLLEKKVLASYDIYMLKNGSCTAQENINSPLQCPNPDSYNLISKRCGKHSGKSTPDCYPQNLRKCLYEKLKKDGSYCLMYIEYEWVKKALTYEDETEQKESEELISFLTKP